MTTPEEWQDAYLHFVLNPAIPADYVCCVHPSAALLFEEMAREQQTTIEALAGREVWVTPRYPFTPSNLKNNGVVAFVDPIDLAQHDQLYLDELMLRAKQQDDLNGRLPRGYRVTYPDGRTVEFESLADVEVSSLQAGEVLTIAVIR